MKRPPIPRQKGVFSDGLAPQMILEGLIIGILALIAYLIGFQWFGLSMARTMTFSVLSLSQLFHVFNVRSKDSLFHIGWSSNRHLNLAFCICLGLQIGVIMVPALADIFRVMPMDLTQWMIVMGLSIAPIPMIELQKWMNRFSEKKEETR